MGEYVKVGNLQVAKLFYEFMNDEVLPGSEVNSEKFWKDFERREGSQIYASLCVWYRG